MLAGALLAVAIAGAGSAIAQDAPDTGNSTDISISVLPGASTPVVNPPQPPATGSNGSDNSSGGVSGTVSARFVLLQANAQTPRDDDATAIMVVRDDRGTAAGWTIAVQSDPALSPADSLALLENLDGTIWRVIPADGRQSEQVLGIHSGHTVGVLVPALPFLRAELGSGSGVFQQTVLVIVPDSAPTLATLTVQITTSP
jgi:hypothetical protein